MPHTRRRAVPQREDGFTLIELLVVVLIIAMLAAIALPTFLGQQTKAQDSSAKSNARDLVSQVEACFTQKQDYTACDTVADLGTTGLPVVDLGSTVTSGHVGVDLVGGRLRHHRRLAIGRRVRDYEVLRRRARAELVDASAWSM